VLRVPVPGCAAGAACPPVIDDPVDGAVLPLVPVWADAAAPNARAATAQM
jgi:hypothetical protein